ncbi:amidase domain-containing protein [Bacillus massilinigeriensis]|uniref:amidase domain-containing protein n=1 Tax=Bacillus mediterraneensis TaxID=1805474 RepID=UPI0008F8F4AB|nr:amidase domain-containing protein [Bacillus mediterraneensis]
MRTQLQQLLESRVQQCVSKGSDYPHFCSNIERKKACFRKRNAEIVKAAATGKILRNSDNEEHGKAEYTVHFQYLIKQKNHFFMEEEIENRIAEFYKDILIEDKLQHAETEKKENAPDLSRVLPVSVEERERAIKGRQKYNRLKAVQYAERWWNENNPAFFSFGDDCTNYISQCLYAGGAPMHGYPKRGDGWWMKNNDWSYSWTVANALRIYLSRPKFGLKTKEMESAEQLLLGDIICYDFNGDGRYDHTTIVTAKDGDGMPLVNAHTTNSRGRYWSYEDSTAYTPEIKYRFFSILNEQ